MNGKAGKSNSLTLQVAVLFAAGILLNGLLTFFSQHFLSDANVKQQTEKLAAEVAQDVRLSVQEYPAYEWLLQYWYEHADELEIEYDADYGKGTLTEEKCVQFGRRYPGLTLKYTNLKDIMAMTEGNRKLYAEIAYSWLITRLNQIKRTYHIDYLFCVVTDESYRQQFFLFSAAEENAVRGTNYLEVYPLGTVVEVGASLENAMRDAVAHSSHLADAGDYVDYYEYLEQVGEDHVALIGITYNLADIRSSIRSQTGSRTFYAVCFQLLLFAIFLTMVYFYVTHPLKQVQTNIRLYKEKKESEEVIRNLMEVHPRNEIGELSGDVAELTREMDSYMNSIRAITAEKERIGTELMLAQRIQASMLPHIFPPFPDRKEFDLYATMDPAKEVGGDFYDYFLIDEDHLGIVMADVSGKGVPAALFMMASKIILQSCAMLGRSAAEILTKTNEAICSNNMEEMFVTVWLGILEISTGRLTAANAGHEYPVLKKPDGPYELLKDRHGFVLGGMDGVTYREYELKLEPGSRLFLYTDGVPEATDAAEQMFGTERMLAALNKDPEARPEDTLRNVRRAVDEFVRDAEQFDDLTMLCLEYRG